MPRTQSAGGSPAENSARSGSGDLKGPKPSESPFELPSLTSTTSSGSPRHAESWSVDRAGVWGARGSERRPVPVGQRIAPAPQSRCILASVSGNAVFSAYPPSR